MVRCGGSWWDTSRVTGGGGTGGNLDFFVSYTGVDRPWAEWIAWTLEARRLPDTDPGVGFRPGVGVRGGDTPGGAVVAPDGGGVPGFRPGPPNPT